MNSRRLSNLGFTLIEVLLATGLLGLLVIAIAAATVTLMKELRRSTLIQTRNQIVNQLRVAATDVRSVAMTMSKPENRELYNCVCGVDTCANIQQPFVAVSLYDAAGQLQSPAFYDEAGMPCSPTQENCLIRVETTFFAQCMPQFTTANQNPPQTCNGTAAEFIAVMYKVDQNPDTIARAGSLIKAVSGPAYSQTADMPPGACP